MPSSLQQPNVLGNHAERMAQARLSLDGLSVGDAFGELFFWTPIPPPSDRRPPPGPWRYTDDTAMAISIVEVLDRYGHIDQDDLARRFAECYRQDPRRGYGGMAHRILQAIGAGAAWRQVARSAFNGEGSMGNGGAMRAGPVGAYFADSLEATVREAKASAEVTHAHPEGQAGAAGVAVAAAMAWRPRDDPIEQARAALFEAAIEHTPEGPTRGGLIEASELATDTPVYVAALKLGNGSEVVAHDTVPFALWCAARHLDDYEQALWTTVSGLGDRDTTCAIVGGIVAMRVGVDGIPAKWRGMREPIL